MDLKFYSSRKVFDCLDCYYTIVWDQNTMVNAW